MRSEGSRGLNVFEWVDERRRAFEHHDVEIAEMAEFEDVTFGDTFGEVWVEPTDPDVALV